MNIQEHNDAPLDPKDILRSLCVDVRESLCEAPGCANSLTQSLQLSFNTRLEGKLASVHCCQWEEEFEHTSDEPPPLYTIHLSRRRDPRTPTVTRLRSPNPPASSSDYIDIDIRILLQPGGRGMLVSRLLLACRSLPYYGWRCTQQIVLGGRWVYRCWDGTTRSSCTFEIHRPLSHSATGTISHLQLQSPPINSLAFSNLETQFLALDPRSPRLSGFQAPPTHCPRDPLPSHSSSKCRTRSVR